MPMRSNFMVRYINRCGSISFPGCTDSHIQIPYKENMRLNTNDFTIEWFQYMEHAPSNAKQAVFSIGRSPNCAIGVTFFYRDELWNLGIHIDGDNYYVCPVEILNTWVHFAITRKGSDLYVFKNGIECTNIDIDANIDYKNSYIILGNVYPPSRKWAFKGCISNFRWTVGKCLYSNDFTPPSTTLKADCKTKLLLIMKNEEIALKDITRNVRDIRHIEGRHISPPADSAEGANKIMWIETTPFSST